MHIDTNAKNGRRVLKYIYTVFGHVFRQPNHHDFLGLHMVQSLENIKEQLEEIETR